MTDPLFPTNSQLYLVARLLGLEQLFLPRHPFPGWSGQRIERRLADDRDELLSEGWLREKAESLQIDPQIAETVVTLARPAYSLMLSEARADGAERAFHACIGGGPWVSLELVEGDRMRVEVLKDAQDLVGSMLEWLAIVWRAIPETPAAYIASETLSRARLLGQHEGSERCQTYLEERGASSSLALLLGHDLGTSRSEGYLSAMAWGGPKPREVAGFGYLRGEAHLWVLEQEQEESKRIRVDVASRDDFSGRIRDALEHALSSAPGAE